MKLPVRVMEGIRVIKQPMRVLTKAHLPKEPVRGVARTIGCTEGQIYTATIGLVVAVVLALAGIPPTLRQRSSQANPPTSRQEPGSDAALELGIFPEATGPVSGIASSIAEIKRETFEAGELSSRPTFVAVKRPFGTIVRFAPVGDPGAPDTVAVDGDGSVYVSTNNARGRGREGPSKVFRYTPEGLVVDEYVIQGQPDNRTDGLTGLAIKEGVLYGLDVSTRRVIRIQTETKRQETQAEIPSLPPCIVPVSSSPCEPGVQDNPARPRSLTFDRAGALYVSDEGQATIWRIPAGESKAQIWHQSMDYASGAGPSGLQFDAAGSLFFIVANSFSPTSFGSGIVYKLEVSPAGQQGARTEFARIDGAARPLGLALGASGRVYVTLNGSHQILVLEKDGREFKRISAPGGGNASEDVVLDGPAGIAFRGFSLMAANQSTLTNNPVRWAVLEVAVEDTGI